MPTSTAAAAGFYLPQYVNTSKPSFRPVQKRPPPRSENVQKSYADFSSVEQIPTVVKRSGRGFMSSGACKILTAVLILCVVGTAVAVPVVLTLSHTTTTKGTTVTTVTVITTTAPPSSVCVTTSVNMNNNQFLYSPTSRVYAAGMLNNQFGIYRAYGYNNVTSSSIWLASQSSTSQAAYLALQSDRNIVVYTTTGNSVLWAMGLWNNGAGNPFCLTIFDSGNLVRTDNTGATIWQTSSAQTG